MRERIGKLLPPLAAIWVLLALVASGCATRTGAEISGKKDWDERGAPTLQYEARVDTSELGGDIEFVTAGRQTVGDILRVDVSLRSKSSKTLAAQYKFEWFDAAGGQISAHSASWTPVMFYPRETKQLVGIAPDMRATGFSLKLLPVK